MATVTVKADPNVLKTTASEITSLTRTLQGDFDALQTCVRQTNRYWLGQAGDQYRREFDAEKTDIEEMLSTLGKYPTDLLSMAGLYEQTETANTERSGVLPSDIL